MEQLKNIFDRGLPLGPDKLECPVCHAESRNVFRRYPSGGYGVACESCGALKTWIRKDNTFGPKEGATKRRGATPPMLIKRCEFCLRSANQLYPSERLMLHHYWPVNAGGTDNRVNRRTLCSTCHALCHTMRFAYHGYRL